MPRENHGKYVLEQECVARMRKTNKLKYRENLDFWLKSCERNKF